MFMGASLNGAWALRFISSKCLLSKLMLTLLILSSNEPVLSFLPVHLI